MYIYISFKASEGQGSSCVEFASPCVYMGCHLTTLKGGKNGKLSLQIHLNGAHQRGIRQCCLKNKMVKCHRPMYTLDYASGYMGLCVVVYVV